MLALSNVNKASDTVYGLLKEKFKKAKTSEERNEIKEQKKIVDSFENLYKELMFEKYPGLEEYETWVETA